MRERAFSVHGQGQVVEVPRLHSMAFGLSTFQINMIEVRQNSNHGGIPVRFTDRASGLGNNSGWPTRASRTC